jgi:tripartite-type tricarboxylate transporter receptor subunit TctC
MRYAYNKEIREESVKSRFGQVAVLLASFVALPIAPAISEDSNYPNKPIRLIIPYAPGGGTDFSARVYADKLSVELGQPVVVENKPGAGGQIGTQLVLNSRPDGYTLLWGGSTQLVVAPLVDKKLPFDPVESHTIAGFTTTFDLVLVVSADSPFDTVEKLVAELKSGKRVTYGSSGVATPVHFGGAIFNSVAGGKAQVIQYNGSAPALQDLIAGRLTYTFDTVGNVARYIESGKLKGLATLSNERAKILPNVPTMKGAGLPRMMDFNWQFWQAVVGVKELPKAIVDKLNAAVAKVSADPDLLAKLEALNLGVMPQISSEEANARLREDIKVVGELIKSANISK